MWYHLPYTGTFLNLIGAIMTFAEWIPIGVVLIGAFGYLIREKVKDMDSSIAKNTAEIVEVKMNYLDRFEQLNANINKGHLEIKEAIADLRIDMVKNYVPRSDCPLLHKQEDADQA